MLLAIALLAEVGAASAPPLDLHFDLKEILSGDPCGASAGDEIVVCGRRTDPERYRLGSVVPDDPLLLPKAETRLFGNAKGAIEGEHVEFGGAVSNRIMVRLKFPF